MTISDHYLLYSYAFLLISLASGLYICRSRWLHLVPEAAYSRLHTSSFEDDIEAGLSSNAFSLSGNVESGDSRGGLDATAKRAVLSIMKKRRVNFDEARRIYMEQRLQQNGIAPDGRPLDPKAVFFS